MSLQALIEIAQTKELTDEQKERLEAHRLRMILLDKLIAEDIERRERAVQRLVRD